MTMTVTFKVTSNSHALDLAKAIQRVVLNQSDESAVKDLRKELDGTPIMQWSTKDKRCRL